MNITNDEVFYIRYDEESKAIEYKTKKKFENKLIEYFRKNKMVFFLTVFSAMISLTEIYLVVKFFSLAGTLVK